MNDFDLNDLLNDPTPLFPEPLPSPSEDFIYLSQRTDQLIMDVNTEHLKIELEILKLQRLRKSVKQLKSEVSILKQILNQKQAENDQLREQMTALNATIFSELTCLTQRIHCCLGRIHHILIAAIHHIIMSEEENQELFQLTYELLRALQLIRLVVYYEEYV